MSRGIFIVGTGTDVGKTYVTGLLVKKIKEAGQTVGYYKAAMSGNDRDIESGSLIPGDALTVKKMSGIDQDLKTMCPYVYEKAVSPHLASRLEGNPVNLEVVKAGFQKVAEAYDYVVMEGSGGILCPVCFDEREIWLEDVIKELNLPTILIADAGLGTINQVVLTHRYMESKGIPIKGVIFNHFYPGDVMEEDNIRMCEYMTKLKTLACVGDDAEDIIIDVDALLSSFEKL